MTNYEKVREFHKAMGVTLDKWPPSELEIEFRTSLITEEYYEMEEELFPVDKVPTDRGTIEYEGTPNLQKVAKELADLLYVVYGTAASFGIDIDKVFSEVHKSNMSKLGEDGKPVYREDGKVMKGPNYKPPQLEFIFK